MKLTISISGHKCIYFYFPTILVFNAVTATILPFLVKKNLKIKITRKQALIMIKAINRYRKSHPQWKIVEANLLNGNHIEITL